MSSPATPGADANRWPAQVKYIVGNEACERFSYYGMKSILALYISTVIYQNAAGARDKATTIIHLFGFANYFMPLLGAWISDKFWGRYKTILWISLFYCAGHGVLALSDLTHTTDGKLMCLYGGLALIAFGSGGIKPCVSAFMGDQFRSDQKHLLQKAYGAFYFSINFGSFFSFLLIPWIKDTVGYGWAFGVPGILMGLATLIFWLGTRHYVRVPPTRETKTAGFFTVLSHALGNQGSKNAGQSFWDVSRGRFSDREVDAAASVLPILSVFALIPPFWALFEQSNSTWVLQGEKMIPFKLVGLTINAEQMQSANPVIVMVLVPLFTLGLYPLLGKLVTPLRRIGLGLILTAVSYLIVGYLQTQIEAGAKVSLAWQFVSYIVLTAGEVLVSTTGLEFAFTQAAPEMKSTIMSFWLLTVAVGNLLVSAITAFAGSGGHDAAVTSGRFYFYSGLTFAVAILFAAVAAFYRYRDTPTTAAKT